ncbi:MAG: M64 family metallopeptidase [Planctomycetota bacterium]
MFSPSRNASTACGLATPALALVLGVALARSAQCQEGTSTPPSMALRVTLAYDGTTLMAVRVEHLTKRAPPSASLAAAIGPATCSFQLEDANGEVLYRRILPGVTPGETEAFPAAPGAPAIQRVPIPGRGKSLVIKLPELPTARDLVILGYCPDPHPGGTPGVPIPPVRLHLKDLHQLKPKIPKGRIESMLPKVTKVVYHGESCWDLVILSEGFEEKDLGKFATETWNFVQQLWGVPPFADVWSAINVYRIDVVSADTGADDPAGAPGSGTGAAPSTAFDAKFCADGATHSLMDVDVPEVMAVASDRVPNWDMALVMVNSDLYGGGEWPEASVGMFSLGASPDGTPAWQTGMHEIGHAFLLGDEYGATGTWNAAFGEPTEKNITMNANPATVKWAPYITLNPVPTVVCTSSAAISPYPPATIGMFEGGARVKCGLFHSEWICKMRHHGYPFCAVCRDAIKAELATFLP